jgi:hypothetical protein
MTFLDVRAYEAECRHDTAMAAQLRNKLLSILTEYDRRESKKKRYNPYALAHYCKGIQNVADAMADGAAIEDALLKGFCGSLLKHIAKKLGLKVEYSKWQ